MAQKQPLFKLDLRIDKKMIKLQVYQEDSLDDLINRLTKAISWKNIAKDKVRQRLEDQFRKLMQKQELSNKVGNKLSELLEESKFVIVNVQTNRNEAVLLNETPFKILQDSLLNGKKIQRQSRQHYHYLDNHLNINYQTGLPQEGSFRLNHQTFKSRSKSQTKFSYFPQDNIKKEDPSDNLLRKRYEALDRKCDQYITQHQDLRQNYNRIKFTSNEVNNENLQHKPKDNSFKRNYQQQPKQYVQIVRYDSGRISQERPALNNNQNRLNRNYKNPYQPGDNNTQTFQDYKIQRYKSHHHIPHKMPKMATESNPRTPPLSHSPNGIPLSRNYGQNVHTKQFSVNMARQPRKFHYLAE